LIGDSCVAMLILWETLYRFTLRLIQMEKRSYAEGDSFIALIK